MQVSPGRQRFKPPGEGTEHAQARLVLETQAGFAIWITRTNDRIDQINDASESLSQHLAARGC